MLSSNGANGGLQKPLRLRRVNHSDEVVSGFSKLLKTESMTDVTLICSGGQTIRAHRVILSTFSPYFRAIFESQPFSNNPCQYPVIVIKDLALSELRTIVEFIYKGEVSVSRDKLSAVLQAAKELEVSGLSDLKVDGNSSSSTSSSSSASPSTTSNNHHTISGINGDIELQSIRNHISSMNNGGSIWKRSHEDHSSNHGSVNSLFNLGYETQMKKSRVTLEGADGIGISVSNALMGDNGSSMVNHDSVRGLLHQPNRISQELQNMRSLHNLSSLNKQRHLTVEQLLQQKQQHIQQRQLLQQKIRVQQQQQQIKQQLLQQQQQLIQKNVSPKSLLQRFAGSPQSNGSSFNQFQEKIKAQMAARNGNSSSDQNKEETEDDNKSKSEGNPNGAESRNQAESTEDETVDVDGNTADEAEDLTNANDGDENGLKEGSDESKETDEEQRSRGRRKKTIPRKTVASDDMVDSDTAENAQGDEDGEDGRKKEENYTNGGGLDEDDDSPVILKTTIDDASDYIDEDDLNEENDDYETNGGIDRDVIFQRQQQLRLQQLQQQQKYQQQMQFQLLQEQQEAKLLELHQQLQQATTNDTIVPDQDDSAPELSLDWQEGFTDESFPLITDLRTGPAANTVITNGNGHDKNVNNGSTTNNGKQAMPDFLQPRGPGRPRKGNKSNDISPCPECNKVFVRPDVLKLHFRSVHLNERHPCNMCPKIFKWPGDLSKHKRTKHPEAMAALNNQKNQSSNS
ncbi:longitudinals lacking protein, isoforms H/M/V isoform X2 [Tetranychus urticae]|uniref:BTB domain-containing protein n=1 Tax=Tetranychus urticae TaxID=32264 RepID=T1K8L8_TETUR|nr:longitudinals lacking protein, isoforms H/M/V isoform X1 [Tetranychus urticae]XP_025016450.1 longitudinals lacking protein, isoforms H/M/V isoform X2 [Tetranychus urticae]